MPINESQRRISLTYLISEFAARFRISQSTAESCVYSILCDAEQVPVFRRTDSALQRMEGEARFSFLEAVTDGFRSGRHGWPARETGICELGEEEALIAFGFAAGKGGNGSSAFENLVPGNRLRPLVEAWPIVQNLLNQSRLQAVTFVEQAVEAHRIRIYVENTHLGLWCGLGSNAAAPLLSDLGRSSFAHDASNEIGDWATIRVTPTDFDLILAEAETIAGRAPNQEAATPPYLDSKHPRYAPKLAAAVSAWLAVTEPKGKHPKGALQAWLTEHAAEFALIDSSGKPNQQGIEECAKVANWQPVGGAPKTPE